MPTFRSTNPARPAEVVAEYPEHTAADVERAVAKASEAQPLRFHSLETRLFPTSAVPEGTA